MSQRIINFIEKYGNLLPKEAIKELNELSIENDYFEKIFNNSPSTISLIDENGYYLSANKKMLELTNLRLEDFVGKKVGELTKNPDILEQFEDIKKSGASHSAHILETIIDNQEKIFWMSINRIGNKFLVIGSDVTDYKKLEKEKMFSDKMAFLGEMSAFIVHEINNPLMTINMASEILQMTYKNDENIIKHTQTIEEMVLTISKIIESLKIFSRKEGGESSEIDLLSLFEKSRMIISGKIKKTGVNVYCENLDGVKITGDEVEYLQVLVNLISNSLDAIKDNKEKWIRVRWENESLKIIDSGKGIPENILPNLFRKFYTSKGSKGNGIGLHLSRTFLNKSGFDLIYKLENGNTSFQWVKKAN